MWNFFARRSKSAAHPHLSAYHNAGRTGNTGESPSATPTAVMESHNPRSSIAEIQFIGTTAVATLTVTELSHHRGAEQLAGLLESLEASGARDYILDIQNVQHMDSACLGCLVEALNHLAASGGRIALANTAHRVQYLFRLTRLDRVFSICPDVITALKTIEQAR